MEILDEQSDTVYVDGDTNSTETVSGGTEVTVKKVKIMIPEQDQTFVKKIQSPVSKIDKSWKVVL